MGRGSSINISERLDQLTGLLRSYDSWTTEELALKLSVSHRTLMRDLSKLKQRGLPIESDKGRGGGTRLNKIWGIGKLNLNQEETIDLLLSLAVMEKIGTSFLFNYVRSIRNKIALSFSDSQKTQIQSLRKRIWLGDNASIAVLSQLSLNSSKCTRSIQNSFFNSSKLQIIYIDEKSKQTCRIIEPQILFLNWPAWYIIAWDELRDAVRVFRLDRIQEAKLLNIKFRLRPDNQMLVGLKEISASL